MSNYHTSLPVSQKLASLGVKAESEMYWKKDEGDVYLVLKNSRYYLSKGEIIAPAYNLAELADVLREVGKIKGWTEDQATGEFLYVCAEFCFYGESAANKYLESIL